MGDLKFGVSLDDAPAMLRAIILETLANVPGLRLVEIPPGEFAPDCRAIILVGEKSPEAHLRGNVECVVNLDPETAHGILYRAGSAARRIDQLPAKALLHLITAEFDDRRKSVASSGWNPFAWLIRRDGPHDAKPPQPMPVEQETRPMALEADAVTAELARLAVRMAANLLPRRHAEGPARELGELLDGLRSMANRESQRLEPLDRIARLFGLEPDERDLLFIASVVEIEPMAARLVALVNDHLSRHRPAVGIVASWGGNPRRLIERLSAGGPLLGFGLIGLEGEGPISTRTVVPAPAIWPLLFDMARTPPFELAREPSPEASFAALVAPPGWKKTFGKALETIRKTPPGDILVAVTGDEDSGRGEIARAIVAGLGQASLKVHGAQLADEAALGAILRESALAEASVILADADQASAAQWHALTQSLQGPLIVTAPAHRLSDLALHSARAMSRIDAPERDHRQRTRLWAAQAPAEWGKPDIAALADRFDFGRFKISAALANARAQATTEGRSTLEPADAARACAVLRNTSFGGSAELLECAFEPDEIVLGDATRQEIDLAIAWARHGSRLFGKGGPGASLHAGCGIACLFTGPPGTGKTMAAQIVARQVDYALYRVDLSQVIDKYIGEGEKRISALFKEARRSRVALFFDEADALFGKRTEVKDSHDRYANIAVNHLLQELEGFDGLSILASNFPANIDSAFMRRIRVRADFPAPTALQRRMIWERLLTKEAIEGSDIDIARLAGDYDLVGGEIRNAVYTAHLLAAEDKGARRLAMRHCLAGLAREISKTGRVVDAGLIGRYPAPVARI